MSICVNLSSKEFKDASERLNIAPSQLEQIVHKYINIPGNENSFPSDAQIKDALKGEPVAYPAEVHKAWEDRFSQPIIASNADTFRRINSELCKIFDEKSIGVQQHNDGSYTIQVAEPIESFDAEKHAEEMQAIKEQAIKNGTFMKAPNGKPTNLTEQQWLQVRTKEFKRWFGDWENNPANASKVVDENGEPLVVYHGSDAIFNTFTKDVAIYTTSAEMAKSYYYDETNAIDDYLDKSEEEYGLAREGDYERALLFLNRDKDFLQTIDSVNPILLTDFEDFIGQNYPEYAAIETEDKDNLGAVYGIFYDKIPKNKYEEIAKTFAESQHPSNRLDYYKNKITGNSYSLFNNIKNPLIINANGKQWNEISFNGKSSQSTRDIENYARKHGYDGFIVYNVKDYGIYVSDDIYIGSQNIYVAFNPNQVKSAIDNTGEFNPDDNNIYHNKTLKSKYYSLLNELEGMQRTYGRISKYTIQQYNQKYGTNIGIDERTGKLTYRDPRIDGVTIYNPNDKTVEARKRIDRVVLLDYLQNKFNLKFKEVSSSEYDRVVGRFSNCCVIGDTVYIRQKDRDTLTNEQVIEEFLHPVINAVYKSNRDLAQKLLQEAVADFPDLWQQIQVAYKNKPLQVQHEELITQVLSKYLNKEISDNGTNTRSLIDYIKQFFNYILDVCKDLFGGEYINEGTHLVKSGKDIAEALSFENLAQLINSKEVSFNDTLDSGEIRNNLNDTYRHQIQEADKPYITETIKIGSSRFTTEQINDIKTGLEEIKKAGFNTVKIPYSEYKKLTDNDFLKLYDLNDMVSTEELSGFVRENNLGEFKYDEKSKTMEMPEEVHALLKFINNNLEFASELIPAMIEANIDTASDYDIAGIELAAVDGLDAVLDSLNDSVQYFYEDSRQGTLFDEDGYPKIEIVESPIDKYTDDLRNILASNMLTPLEIADEGTKFAEWISDRLTEYQEDPDAVFATFENDIQDTEENRQKITEGSRKDILDLVGIDRLINLYKETILTSASGTMENGQYLADGNVNLLNADDTTLNNVDLIRDNFRAIVLKSMAVMLQNENFALTISETDGSVQTREKTEEETEEEISDINNEEMQGEREYTMDDYVEHYQIDIQTKDILYTAGEMVKQRMSSFYLTDRDGNYVLDYLGRRTKINKVDATRSVVSWIQGATTLSQMTKYLKAQQSEHPWVSQLVELLEDKTGKESDFQNQFFPTFYKPFKAADVVIYNKGKKMFNVVPTNEKKAVREVLKSIQVAWKVNEHPLIKKNGTINKQLLDKLADTIESAIGKRKGNAPIEITADNIDTFTNCFVALTEAFGYPISADTIKNTLNNGNINTLLNRAVEAINALYREANSPSIGYDPFTYNQAKGKNSNRISGYLRGLYDPFVKSIDDTRASSFYSNGKMFQSYQVPSYAVKFFEKMRSDDATFKQYIIDEFSKTGWFVNRTVQGTLTPETLTSDVIKLPMLKELVSMTQEQREKVFKFSQCVAFKKKAYMVDMTSPEYAIMCFAKFFKESSNSKESRVLADYRFPIEGNKKAAEFFQWYRYTGNGEFLKSPIIDQMTAVFMQELGRIQTVRTRNLDPSSKEYIENFDKNGRDFCFLNWFNDYLNGDLQNTEFGRILSSKLKGENVDRVKFQNYVKDIIRAKMEEKVSGLTAAFQQNGIFEALKSVENIGNSDVAVRNAIENFVWNDTIGAISITELLVTDLAFYKNAEDFQKRFPQVHSPGIRGNVEAIDYNGKPVTDGKIRAVYLKDFAKIASNITDNIREVFSKRIRRAETEEEKAELTKMLDSIIDIFNDVVASDSQAYTTLTGYRKKGFTFGKWSRKKERLFNLLKSGKANTEDLKTVFQPLKPFTYTQVSKPSGYTSEEVMMSNIKVPMQNKDVEYLLLMTDALIAGEGGSKINLLRALMEFAENTAKWNDLAGIDQMVYGSSVKSGKMAELDIAQFADLENTQENRNKVVNYLMDNVFNRDSSGKINIHDYNKTVVHEMNFEDYCLQLDFPPHFRDAQNIWPSQTRCIIPSDLPAMYDGQPVRITFNDAGEQKSLTPEEFKREYEETTAAIVRHEYNRLVEEFKLGSGDPRVRNAALSKLLQREILSSSRYGIDLLLSCSLDENGQFIVPLGEQIQAKRVEQLINSIIRNRINRIMLPGGSLIQIANTGMPRRLETIFADKDTKEPLPTKQEYLSQGHTEEEYRKYLEEHQGGILHHETMTPPYSDEIIREFADKTTGRIDVEMMEWIHPDMLMIKSDRVPVEHKYSDSIDKIVDFLPKEAGDGKAEEYEEPGRTGADKDGDSKKIQRKTYKLVKKEKGGPFALRHKIIDRIDVSGIELTEEQKRDIEGKLSWDNSIKERIIGGIEGNYAERENSIIADNNAAIERLSSIKSDKIRSKKEADIESKTDKKLELLAKQKEAELADIEKRFNEKRVKLENDAKKKAINSRVTNILDKYSIHTNTSSDSIAEEDRPLFTAIKRAYTELKYGIEWPQKGTLGYYQNKIFDMTRAVLQHPATAEQQLDPGGFTREKRIGYLVEAYRNTDKEFSELSNMSIDQLKALAYSASNLMFFDAQLKFYEQNSVSGQILGMFAVQRAAHGILEGDGYHIKVPKRFKIGSYTFKGLMELDKQVNVAGENIGRLLGEGVACAADGVKDPVFGLYNVNKNTVNVYTTAIRLGMPHDEIALFLATGTIKNLISQHSKELLDKNVSITSVAREMVIKMAKDNKISRSSRLNREALTRDEILRDIKSSDSINIQYKILKSFIQLSELSDKVLSLTMATRYNSVAGATGPLAVDNNINMYRLNRDVDGIFRKIDGKFVAVTPRDVLRRHPMVQALSSGYRLADAIFRAFPSGSESFTVNVLQQGSGNISRIINNNRQIQLKLVDFFTGFLMIRNGVIPLSGNKQGMDYYLNTFPTDLLKSKLKSRYPKNPFVQALNIEEDASGKLCVKIDTVGMEESERENLSIGWAQLLVDNPTAAKHLFFYNFFRGGLGFNPRTFMNLCPIQLKQAIPGYLDAYRKIESVYGPVLLDSFVRHNIADNRLVPTFTDKELTGRLTSDKKIKFDKAGYNKVRDYDYFKLRDKNGNMTAYRVEMRDPQAFTAIFAPVDPLGNNGEFLDYRSAYHESQMYEGMPVDMADYSIDDIVDFTTVESESDIDSYMTYEEAADMAAEITNEILTFAVPNDALSSASEVLESPEMPEQSSQMLDWIEKRFNELGIPYDATTFNEIKEEYC